MELLDALPLKSHKLLCRELAAPREHGLNMDVPSAVRRRLEGIAKLANTMLALDKKGPEHKRTFGGKLARP
jgi:hypothetical protein